MSATFHNLLPAKSFFKRKSAIMNMPSIDIQKLEVYFIIFMCVHVCLCE